jgi:4-amino-4-deoxy-L-arabinose transferase-like glycosyltransferase
MPRKRSVNKYLSPVATAFRLLYENPLIVLVFASFAMGLAWMVHSRGHPFSDYRSYFNLAQNILDHQQFGWPEPTARRLPGYPGFLSIPMLVSRSFLWLGFFNLLLNSMLVPVVYHLVMAMKIGTRKTALIAAGLCAFNPTFVFFSPVLASEHLFVLLFFTVLLLVFLSGRRPVLRLVLAGALLGWAVLTRGEVLFYLPVVALSVWTVTDGDWRRKTARVTLVLGVCLITVAPWAVRNRVVIGPGVGLSSVGGANFYFGHNDTKYGYHQLKKSGQKQPVNIRPEGEWQKFWLGQGLANLKDKPSRIFEDVKYGTGELLVKSEPYAAQAAFVVRSKRDPSKQVHRSRYPWGVNGSIAVFYRFVFLAAIAGLLLVRKLHRRDFFVLYGIIAMNWVCYSVIFWSKPRFRYTSEVVMCVIAALVLCRVGDFINQNFRDSRR